MNGIIYRGWQRSSETRGHKVKILHCRCFLVALLCGLMAFWKISRNAEQKEIQVLGSMFGYTWIWGSHFAFERGSRCWVGSFSLVGKFGQGVRGKGIYQMLLWYIPSPDVWGVVWSSRMLSKYAWWLWIWTHPCHMLNQLFSLVHEGCVN